MALPTGTISASQINTELGRSATANMSIAGTAERALAGVSSGAISMDSFRGKSSYTHEGLMTAGQDSAMIGYNADSANHIGSYSGTLYGRGVRQLTAGTGVNGGLLVVIDLPKPTVNTRLRIAHTSTPTVFIVDLIILPSQWIAMSWAYYIQNYVVYDIERAKSYYCSLYAA